MESSSVVKAQYRKVYMAEWCEVCFAKVEFLQILLNSGKVYQNTIISKILQHILTCLITPASNAIVVRILSLVTAIKTKSYNKTQIKLLDALLD